MQPYASPSRAELQSRVNALHERLDRFVSDWNTMLIVSQVNLYYLCGTRQDGILVLRRGEDPILFARRSYERATAECSHWTVLPMRSYAQVAERFGAEMGVALLETETLTFAAWERLQKALRFTSTHSLEPHILAVRAKKTPFELSLMREAGRLHHTMMTSIVPELLTEGVSEAAFLGRLYAQLLERGHHGVARFRMFQMELIGGQLGFGENSVYPTNFDGPGGMRGQSPAVPCVGSRERTLRKGDLAFVDIVSGIDGYHTDKTQVYCLSAQPPPEAVRDHRACMTLLNKAAALLRPGVTPAEIYRQTVETQDEAFRRDFMGYGNRTVAFLGHGVGLQVDEAPVIAAAFTEPLEAGMTVALEPKKGRPEGMVGVEESYLVTESGGECLTGGARDIMIL